MVPKQISYCKLLVACEKPTHEIEKPDGASIEDVTNANVALVFVKPHACNESMIKFVKDEPNTSAVRWRRSQGVQVGAHH